MLKTRLVQLFGIAFSLVLAAVCVAGLYPVSEPVFFASSYDVRPGEEMTIWGMGFSLAQPDFNMVIGGAKAKFTQVGRIRIKARVPANSTDGVIQIHGFPKDVTLSGLRTGKPAFTPKPVDPAFKPKLGTKDDKDQKGNRIFLNLLRVCFDTDVDTAVAEKEIEGWGGQILTYQQLDNSYQVAFPKVKSYDEIRKISESASKAPKLTCLAFEKISEKRG